jgi:hypothetical protein
MIAIVYKSEIYVNIEDTDSIHIQLELGPSRDEIKKKKNPKILFKQS